MRDPLPLSPEQEALAGKRLAKLLRSRVAYHHSGLSYAVRAGLIEPLAKAGQLNVVVATMGLAAGINFSMRSVLITDTRYMAGNFERHVQPDELLQMFGRAGRRGLDETGYVLHAAGYSAPGRRAAAPVETRHAGGLAEPHQRHARRGRTGRTAICRRGRIEPFAFQHAESSASAPNIPSPPDEKPCGLWVDAERARFVRRPIIEMLELRGRMGAESRRVRRTSR